MYVTLLCMCEFTPLSILPSLNGPIVLSVYGGNTMLNIGYTKIIRWAPGLWKALSSKGIGMQKIQF